MMVRDAPTRVGKMNILNEKVWVSSPTNDKLNNEFH
jgi:hypothetical protein